MEEALTKQIITFMFIIQENHCKISKFTNKTRILILVCIDIKCDSHNLCVVQLAQTSYYKKSKKEKVLLVN